MTLQAQDTPIEKGTIKVLHLIDSGGLYGAEKMLLTLVAEQIKQGLESVILSAGEKGIEDKAIEVEARRLGLPVKAWRMTPGFNLKEAWKILKWAKINEFDVIHSHGYKFNILMGLLPRKMRSIPLVVTLHGYVNAKRYTKMWLYEVLDRFVLKRIDKVCLVSPHMKSLSVIKKLSPEKVIVIENGLPASISNSKKEIPKEISDFTNEHSFNLLAVGRLSPEKNFAEIIRVLASGEFKKRNIGLSVIGDGSLFYQLKMLRDECGLAEKVQFFGYRSDVVEIMSEFDLLVMPSLTEGLPVTLLEAMREGLPVIASNVGGLPSVLDNGNAGFIYQADKENALHCSLLSIINDSARLAEMSISAKSQFSSRFSSVVMAGSYKLVYEKN
ncbi:glycosyltransferase [Marinobacter sp. V034]|uniref:glycosyltransferase n=1 Tax=Marinobacter sp. V034 TaxID=3459610 RepID=UPI004043DE40